MGIYTRGDQLPARLQTEVLNMYVHRHTVENGRRRGGCVACLDASRDRRTVITGPKSTPRVWTIAEWHAYHVPAITDREWLKSHAFAVTARGELSRRQTYAQPAALVDGDGRD